MAETNYTFDIPKPLDMVVAEIEPQKRLGKGSLRLDTGSSATQDYNWLGLPVFSAARLQNPADSTDFIKLLSVRFVVTQTKNIDVVAVNGVSGTIKTYINDGDFSIDMQVILSTDNADDYPIDAARQLLRFLRMGKALPIMCDFLQLFAIFEIVVTDFEVAQLEGIQNAQTFSISALSDAPLVLIEKR